MNTSDSNVVETDERLDAFEAVRACRGSARASDWVSHLVDAARREGSYLPRSLTTTHKNTISPEQQEKSPADRTIEHRLLDGVNQDGR